MRKIIIGAIFDFLGAKLGLKSSKLVFEPGVHSPFLGCQEFVFRVPRICFRCQEFVFGCQELRKLGQEESKFALSMFDPYIIYHR